MGSAANVGRKNVTTRHTRKPAVAELPSMGPKNSAKPPSAPPVPPGRGTAVETSWTIEPAARDVRKSASMPKAWSTNHGTM